MPDQPVLRSAIRPLAQVIIIAIIVFCAGFLSSPAKAQWGHQGYGVCTASDSQLNVVSVSDGQGGSILVWEDRRSGNHDIYAQRLNAAGIPQWVAGGISVCNASSDQIRPTAVADGSGGVIAAWMDARSSRFQIFVQRVDSTGVLLWTSNGVQVASMGGGPRRQRNPTLAAIPAGGAYVAWDDTASGSQQVFFRRVRANGSLVGPGTGTSVPVLGGSDRDYLPTLAPLNGKAVLTWLKRPGARTQVRSQMIDTTGTFLWTMPYVAVYDTTALSAFEVKSAATANSVSGGSVSIAWSASIIGSGWGIASAQRLDSTGTPLYGTNGIRLAGNIISNQVDLSVVDVDHGTIVSWTDDRVETQRPYAQKVGFDDSGDFNPEIWGHSGMVLNATSVHGVHTQAVSDQAGGATIVWEDYTSGAASPGIYGARILDGGTRASGWPAAGLVIADTTGAQQRPCVCTDGGGGATVAWVDQRAGTAGDIYSQTVSAAAALGWQHTWLVNGVQINSGLALQTQPISVPDGVGGEFVVWQDLSSGNVDIYAQRVTPEGTIAAGWPLSGLPVCTSPGHQYLGGVAWDNQDGVLISWADGRDTLATGYNIYAQRINRNAIASWTAQGLAVCTVSGNQIDPAIAPSLFNSAVVTWTDGRGADPDIYSQRISATGVLLWASGGVAVSSVPGSQDHPTIVSDGAGGSVVAWEDTRGGDLDVYAVRLDASGAPAAGWAANGTPVSATLGDQALPLAIQNGLGGAMIVWTDNRGGDDDIYAANVDSTGAAVSGWPANGRSICSAPGEQTHPTIVSDGAGGGLIAWSDVRGVDSDIYACGVNSNGSSLWPIDGRAVCQEPGEQTHPTIVSDGASPIIVWVDERGPSKPGRKQSVRAAADRNIYAQKLNPNGSLNQSLFPVGGLLVCGASGEQSTPTAVVGFDHSFYVTWADARSGTASVYTNRILSQGQVTPVIGVNTGPEARPRLWAEPPFPNPSRGAAELRFSLPASGPVSGAVYGVDGRSVRTLVGGSQLSAGAHRLRWDGNRDDGRPAGSGVYFMKLVYRGEALTSRLVLLR